MEQRIATEHEEQRAFVSWFRQTYPDVLIFAIPNGELRSIRVASRLKLEGVTPGIPDLFIPAWGIWIEMKRTKGGVVSKQQKEIIAYLEESYIVLIGRGALDAQGQLLKCCNLPTKGLS